MIYYAEAKYFNINKIKPILKLAKKLIDEWYIDNNEILYIKLKNKKELVVHKEDILFILDDELDKISPKYYDLMMSHLAYYIDKHINNIKYLMS